MSAYPCEEMLEWLKGVYGGEEPPDLELSSEVVEVLSQLQLQSQRAESDAAALCDDYRNKTAEYQAKTVQLRESLEGIGVAKGGLSPEVREIVQSVAHLGTILELSIPSSSAIAAAVTDVELEHDRLKAEVAQAAKLKDRVMEVMEQLTAKMAQLENICVESEAFQAIEERQLAANRQRETFHEQKLQEYRKDIANRKAELNFVSYSEDISHEKLLRNYDALVTLRQTVAELSERLEKNILPLNITDAKIEVERLRQELQGVMDAHAEDI